MLDILGMIILIIILFIIILLAAGIKIRFEYTKKDSEFKGCLKILILKKIKIYSHDFPSAEEENEDDKTETTELDYIKLLDLAKPCIKDIINYLITVIKTLKIAKIENHIIFGLDSFAETGKYIGIIWGILSVINTINENLKISAEPSFTGVKFDGCGINDLEIYPLKIIMPTIRLLLNRDVQKLIRGVLNE